MQSEWVHSEEKKKACAGYENHVNGYNVYQDAQITPTNEDKSCLAHTSTHTFNQLRILYTAYMYTLNWTDRGRASVEVIIVIVIVIECWIPTTEQFHNGIVLIEIHLNGIGKYGYFFVGWSACTLFGYSEQKWPIERLVKYLMLLLFFIQFHSKRIKMKNCSALVQHGIRGHKSLESPIQTFAVIIV